MLLRVFTAWRGVVDESFSALEQELLANSARSQGATEHALAGHVHTFWRDTTLRRAFAAWDESVDGDGGGGGGAYGGASTGRQVHVNRSGSISITSGSLVAAQSKFAAAEAQQQRLRAERSARQAHAPQRRVHVARSGSVHVGSDAALRSPSPSSAPLSVRAMHDVASIPLPPPPLERGAPSPLDAPPIPPPRPASMGSGGAGARGDVRAESVREVESAAAAWGEVRVKVRAHFCSLLSFVHCFLCSFSFTFCFSREAQGLLGVERRWCGGRGRAARRRGELHLRVGGRARRRGRGGAAARG